MWEKGLKQKVFVLRKFYNWVSNRKHLKIKKKCNFTDFFKAWTLLVFSDKPLSMVGCGKNWKCSALGHLPLKTVAENI